MGWVELAAFELERDTDLGPLALPVPGALATTFRRNALEDGAPAAVARFLLENRAAFATVLDFEGEFPDVLELAPGSYVLQVELVPGPQAEYAFEIRAGESTALEVDLSSTCLHRVVVSRSSGLVPTDALSLIVKQLDLERTLVDGMVTRLENDRWVQEVELPPGRFEFMVRTSDGHEARMVHSLFTSTPGRELELVVEDG